MRSLLTFALAAAVAVTGCGGSGNPAGPSGPGTGNPSNGSASATIDGTALTATTVTAQCVNSMLTIGVGTATHTIAFSVITTGPGTVPVPGSPGGTDAGNNAVLTQLTGASVIGTWFCNLIQGGSGSVTITSLTATAVAGTFTFNLVPAPGSVGNRSITQGQFNIRF